ncbi:protein DETOXIFICATION 32-like isoform X2 [Cornus florida]|uniref:protein DETOXIFICATION 32-like isoform X2 n=1 Tax=Cornus florida TaxID=4283 RepID=UPI00289EB8AD|nr:protein DETOXIFICATION 32-like isoform X2 [Cornus florida]
MFYEICSMNILGWAIMVAFGFNAATSVRVSNELGTAHPRSAKFSVVVVSVTSVLFGLLLALILIINRRQYPALFSNNAEVKQLVIELTPLLGVSIVINNIQPALSGVAIGAGWQAIVAYVNIGCYYLFGIPFGLLTGYKFGMGVRGIWYGMLSGTGLQTCFLFWLIYRTNWKKEALIAGERIKQWEAN